MRNLINLFTGRGGPTGALEDYFAPLNKSEAGLARKVAGFIVDLYCASLRLVVELDGGTHDDPTHAKRDALRTEVFVKLAITVVRLRNDLLSEHLLRQLLTPYAQPSRGRKHGSDP